MSRSKDPLKISLWTRLRVWWEGYDIRDVEKRLVERAQKAAQSEPVPAAPPAEIDAVLPVAPWDRRRIEIAQYIWGEGYCGPGGPEHVIALSKLLAMSPEMSALVIGAGLGGPSRVLAQEFGVWITGVEESSQLAEAGMELSHRAGLAKKAEICHYEPKNPEFDRNFDRAFAKEALFTVEDKGELLLAIQKKLKADSLFLMTDYYISSPAVMSTPAFLEWREKEPQRPYPVTGEDMLELIKRAGFTVRVNEDVSEQYNSMIARAWSEADKAIAKLLSQGEEGRALVDVLMREAELWSRRSKLLESNVLQVHRILASKKVTKTMSNW
ncbi:SAM-dependent methyltransferase [Govanella unica]|uniref:Class I SAM-dependent methyltransferase n=1 Tax=Govanella unica TaxID=2975056 RepID=A0A9X3TWP6_9PROT|nr:class I SAM-dependent methyltransferase [Govania unica]MDA5192969.1 class I SAM-dependent methyltransferase [Govania unica]